MPFLTCVQLRTRLKQALKEKRAFASKLNIAKKLLDTAKKKALIQAFTIGSLEKDKKELKNRLSAIQKEMSVLQNKLDQVTPIQTKPKQVKSNNQVKPNKQVKPNNHSPYTHIKPPVRLPCKSILTTTTNGIVVGIISNAKDSNGYTRWP